MSRHEPPLQVHLIVTDGGCLVGRVCYWFYKVKGPFGGTEKSQTLEKDKAPSELQMMHQRVLKTKFSREAFSSGLVTSGFSLQLLYLHTVD